MVITFQKEVKHEKRLRTAVLEGERSSAETQVAGGNNYGNLQSPFKNFQNNLKLTSEQQKKVN